jgi:DNA-binding NarL/FixJ family response regulator
MEAQISEDENAPIRVLIVDDHILLRQGIRAMLNAGGDFEIIGETENERAALSLAKELQPDIVLLDIFLETANGLDLATQLLRSCPNTRIVLFAGPNKEKNEKLLFDALRIGVHGYLQRTLSIDDLRRSLRAVQRGERVLGEAHAITQVAIEFNHLIKEQNRLRRGLSTTDVELVRFVAKGFTNKEIGKQLFWSEIQVKRKMQDIYRKLQVTDRAHAVAEAMHQGLI